MACAPLGKATSARVRDPDPVSKCQLRGPGALAPIANLRKWGYAECLRVALRHTACTTREVHFGEVSGVTRPRWQGVHFRFKTSLAPMTTWVPSPSSVGSRVRGFARAPSESGKFSGIFGGFHATASISPVFRQIRDFPHFQHVPSFPLSFRESA